MSATHSGPRRNAGVAGAFALASDYADEMFLCAVRDVHGAVAKRAFGITNRATRGSARAPQLLHDGISGACYRAIGVGLKATGTVLRAADRRGLGGPLEAGPHGRFVMSAVNGLIGDRLAEDHSALAIEMAVRLRGEDVLLDPAHLAAAFPEATSDLVLFVHGLSESEHHWDRGREESGGNYGERLARQSSWSPLFLRVNTGLPIAENGATMARLVDRLIAAWPVDVRRIALVGHSMGGLILRAACAVVTDGEARWNELVTDVITLGTPHLGAPIERGLHLGTRVLGLSSESAPLGRILEHRSVGILNLRAGLARDVRHLPHARYHLVAATLNASHRHPVSGVLGDMLVRYPSATGRPRRGREMFPGADVLHVPGTGHFGLLNHPDVYDAIKRWLV